MYKKIIHYCLLLSSISLISCNTTSLEFHDDPLELLNRKVFSANDTVDQALLRPVSLFYRRITPKLLQNDIDNFLQWLDSDLIPRLLEIFEKLKSFMIILLNVTNDACSRILTA